MEKLYDSINQEHSNNYSLGSQRQFRCDKNHIVYYVLKRANIVTNRTCYIFIYGVSVQMSGLDLMTKGFIAKQKACRLQGFLGMGNAAGINGP